MKLTRIIAAVLLLLIVAGTLGARYFAPAGYEQQFRESLDAPPSAQHLLGTDDLGRDRLARLLFGTRISLLLAPLAAALPTLLAAFIGGMAGYFGGRGDRGPLLIGDLFLAVA